MKSGWIGAKWLLAAVFSATTFTDAPGWQQPVTDPSTPPPTEPAPTAPAPEEVDDRLDASTTRHVVTVNGQEIAYTATAGTLTLAEEDGKPKANIFFVAYLKEGVQDSAKRPITFCFNGGPGSSSVWLHMGAFGPRRVVMGDEGQAPPPPYQLVDNEHSILDLTDLVFIDPVTTGYSRAVPGESDKPYHGLRGDIESVGEFIRLWTTRWERWSSPKFLAGESYGTTRAAGLSGHLQERHGMFLNGIVLISSVLDFGTLRFNLGNDLPYIVYLPTYTATAWYHGALDADLQARPLRELLDEVEEFALNEYATALLKGDRLGEVERADVLARLARYTGLDEGFVERADLRISQARFSKELLRDEENRTVGRLDSRFKGIDRDAVNDSYEYDPSYSAILGPYTATLNDYVRRELGYESDLPYEILTGRVHPWSFDGFEGQYVTVADTLRSAMTENPHLRVFVANGYYDLATPYFATEHTFHHLGLDPELSAHVTMGYYDAGHMMYIRLEDLAKLKQDLTAFYAEAMAVQ